MSFWLLALIVLVGLLGPLLAAPSSWRVPTVAGELAGGILIGDSGFRLVNPDADAFRLLATIGFGLVMVVAGSHVPLKAGMKTAAWHGLLGAALVGCASAVVGTALAAVFGTGHAAVYAVILASSSAALVLPMLPSARLAAPALGALTTQIAIADAACIVLLPFTLMRRNSLGPVLGALLIVCVAAALAWLLIRLGRTRARQRFHVYSERHRFAGELRLSLLVLFTVAGIAQSAGLSVMFAGFALGLVLSAAGEPRRLARQLFGMTEGFFSPLFFVWLGASVNIVDLGRHPMLILLGAALGVGAVVTHLSARAAGLPWAQTVVAAGQLGVPVAAVTLGLQEHLLVPGEGAAILLGALITVVASVAAVGMMGPRRRADSAAVPRRRLPRYGHS